MRPTSPIFVKMWPAYETEFEAPDPANNVANELILLDTAALWECFTKGGVNFFCFFSNQNLILMFLE